MAGEPGRPARDILAAWRAEGTAHLRERFRRAVGEGDLPAGADPALLARYLMTVANGIAVQAAGGAPRDELQQMADLAMRSRPPASRNAVQLRRGVGGQGLGSMMSMLVVAW